jgi:hypothetical protein
MAFRLHSAIAGAAKKATENLDELDKEYRESIRNTAANLAKEAATIRKQRMAAVTDYNRRARKLRNNYDLSDAQIQTLLSGGVEEYDNFEKTITAGETAAKLRDPEATFDAKAFAQKLFVMPETGVTGDILSIAEQAERYAAQTTPAALDVQTLASGIAAGTKTAITGIGTEDVAQRLREAAGTTLPTDYTGPAAGDTGIRMQRLGGLSPTDLIAAQQAAAELEQTQKTTEGITADIELKGVRGDLIKAQTKQQEIINKQLPTQLSAELDGTYASTKLKEAQTGEAEERREKTILEQTKLAEEIVNYQTFGTQNEQLALDLLEAKINKANSPADLEQLQATYLMQASKLEQKAAGLSEDDPNKASLTAQAKAMSDRATNVQNMITAQDTTASVDWSKGSPESRFAGLLKTSVQAANISGSLNSAGEWQWDFANKRPAYYTAFNNAVEQYAELYSGKGSTGATSSAQNYVQLNNILNQWSAEGKFVTDVAKRTPATTSTPQGNVNFGTKTPQELAALQSGGNLVPGDIVTIADSSGKEYIAMYSTQGDWISAGDF